MTATVQIGTVVGEPLVAVAYDRSPYVSLTVRGQVVALTRDEARRVADALRACAMTAVDEDCAPS